MMDEPLTDEQRFPLLTEQGRRMLRWLQEHPHAPRYNHRCGDRLTADGLRRVRAFAEKLRSSPRGWGWGEPALRCPPWLREFVAFCLADVPFYRRAEPLPSFWDRWPASFVELPTTAPHDLRREPWAFVPDSQPLEDLIVYPTSGTTGNRRLVLTHPEVSGCYLPLMQRALATRGVTLDGGPGRVAIVHVCAQKETFTLATISSYLGEAGFVKVNLNPAEWRDPEDRVQFLESCDPELYTGDPIAFDELARLPIRTRPKALISSALALLPGFQAEMESRFGCPVVDIYSMTESGPIAVATSGGHEILPHDLYVEILSSDGTPCEPGARGEIALTGGRNPFLPLLRYRTGDWASLEYHGSVPILVGLEGRAPTIFRAADGGAINNLDVTAALQPYALSRFSLHQAEDGSLQLRARGSDVPQEALRRTLGDLFGTELTLAIEEIGDSEAWSGKPIRYTSAWRAGKP